MSLRLSCLFCRTSPESALRSVLEPCQILFLLYFLFHWRIVFGCCAGHTHNEEVLYNVGLTLSVWWPCAHFSVPSCSSVSDTTELSLNDSPPRHNTSCVCWQSGGIIRKCVPLGWFACGQTHLIISSYYFHMQKVLWITLDTVNIRFDS